MQSMPSCPSMLASTFESPECLTAAIKPQEKLYPDTRQRRVSCNAFILNFFFFFQHFFTIPTSTQAVVPRPNPDPSSRTI